MREFLEVQVPSSEDSEALLTDEEESRYRELLFRELGSVISERGWVRYPAHSPEERRRLVDVAARLGEWWGRRVFVEAEDVTRLRLYLAGYEAAAVAEPVLG
ncbi:hypothetical protein [Streptomyces sp. NRRL F-2799]|uniref:hypothetical protein n=1 Tax=Streptomyces sp. NRRL F-2799 TaxID=1463844 RepID=UPI000691C4D9|nr:hypothetical protein [Streptomyces sp. NRRL F-2799]